MKIRYIIKNHKGEAWSEYKNSFKDDSLFIQYYITENKAISKIKKLIKKHGYTFLEIAKVIR